VEGIQCLQGVLLFWIGSLLYSKVFYEQCIRQASREANIKSMDKGTHIMQAIYCLLQDFGKLDGTQPIHMCDDKHRDIGLVALVQ